MDKPEPVRRVTPPKIIMPKMVVQQASNHIAMALWFLLSVTALEFGTTFPVFSKIANCKGCTLF